MHSYQRILTALVLAAIALGGQPRAGAQGLSYSQSYRKEVMKRPTVGLSTDRYLYNRYYRSNPAISPYISGAILGGTDRGNAYTTVIRPEQQRRAAAQRNQMQYVQQRKMQGNVGYTKNPGATYLGTPSAVGYRPPKPKPAPVGAYQNHWYGGWNR